MLISSEPDRLQKYGLFHKFNTTIDLYNLISKVQSDPSMPSVNIYGPDIEHTWKIFRIYFTEVGAAGGLVRHATGKYLFIEKKGKLDLPKGHIEPGETSEACALREVSEECGISGHYIIKSLKPSYHTYTWEGISYLKRTCWFLMDYDGPMVTEPQIKEGITRVDWLSPDDLSRIKSTAWLSLMDLINTYVMRAG